MSEYICIQLDGRFYGWTHNSDGSWEKIAQFKKAEGIDRANIRFGNVNERGGDDMIWIDKFIGDATVYINNGKMDTGGSNWWFLKSGKQHAGSWAGTCQYFPDLDGDGRADLHSIMNSFTNRGETFFNRCGFGALPAAPSDDKPGNGGNVPALPSTCENICWNVFDNEMTKCSRDGTGWDMENRDDDIPDGILNIRKLAAIGDSYSAGIGAGDRLGSIYDALKMAVVSEPGPSGAFPNTMDTESNLATQDFACARYDHAYPYLVNQDSRIGDPSGRKF
ncbi:hypothetical protein N0V84_012688 [Fusarium piperis]|uniref:SGNH hydrolase-type esterase domain-containing protein n=1 Tax=Fusarium piperis TaxID=1435070 RepID=A0A9W8TC23_9HYPO|nr:hypothetical protein N0V84_012688 [Fusarium piperis]